MSAETVKDNEVLVWIRARNWKHASSVLAGYGIPFTLVTSPQANVRIKQAENRDVVVSPEALSEWFSEPMCNRTRALHHVGLKEFAAYLEHCGLPWARKVVDILVGRIDSLEESSQYPAGPETTQHSLLHRVLFACSSRYRFPIRDLGFRTDTREGHFAIWLYRTEHPEETLSHAEGVSEQEALTFMLDELVSLAKEEADSLTSRIAELNQVIHGAELIDGEINE